MENSVYREICAVLDTPQPFFYFRDRYALRLLSWAAGSGTSRRALAKGPFARLLDKPLVKERLATAGGGVIDDARLMFWPKRYHAFRWTLGRWGRELGEWRPNYDQTTRPGTNLVLQLNFSAAHDRHYDKLLRRPGGPRRSFNYRNHPCSRELQTLAWARIDLDLETREALIEEVQSDWVRFTTRLKKHSVPTRRYDDRVFWPYRSIWAEATLAAAIELLYRELGIHRIYFHTHEGGARLKELPPAARPPRRIYTKLPRSFCFRKTNEAPRFLRTAKTRFVRERVATVRRWQLLELPKTPTASIER